MSSPAPLTANIDVEFNNSCNGCCFPIRSRRTRAQRVSAHSATLKEIQEREIAQGSNKTNTVAKEVLGYKVAE
jgi:hypothetical protein